MSVCALCLCLALHAAAVHATRPSPEGALLRQQRAAWGEDTTRTVSKSGASPLQMLNSRLSREFAETSTTTSAEVHISAPNSGHLDRFRRRLQANFSHSLTYLCHTCWRGTRRWGRWGPRSRTCRSRSTARFRDCESVSFITRLICWATFALQHKKEYCVWIRPLHPLLVACFIPAMYVPTREHTQWRATEEDWRSSPPRGRRRRRCTHRRKHNSKGGKACSRLGAEEERAGNRLGAPLRSPGTINRSYYWLTETWSLSNIPPRDTGKRRGIPLSRSTCPCCSWCHM